MRCHRKAQGGDRIMSEPAKSVVLFYHEGKLARTAFAFSESRFDALAAELTREFGDPVAGSEALKAGMGGVFENRYLIWRDDGRAWMVEQFFERITDSGFWSMSETELDALLAERERERVRGARDL